MLFSGWGGRIRQGKPCRLQQFICPFCFAKDGLIGSNPAEQSKQKNNRCKNVSEKLITTRNRAVAKQRRCKENMIVGNYFFIFYDMPHFVRRDIFAFAKVIL